MTNNESEFEYVGFWLRVWASVIDTVLVLLIIGPLLWTIYGREYFSISSDKLIQGPADLLISYVLPAVGIVAFWIARQATPGKMAIGARIVDVRSGAAPSPRQLIIRYLGYYVSLIPFGLGMLWVALDPRKQGWHDKLAGTAVVRVRHVPPRPL